MSEAATQQQQTQQTSVQQGQAAVQQQQEQKTFFDSLSEDIRIAYPGLAKKNFTDVNALAKSYGEAEKALHSADKVAIPTDGTQASFNEVMNRLGRPSEFSYEDYSFAPVKGAPAELNPNGDFMKKMAKVMHYAGLTPNQARGLINVAGKLLAESQGAKAADLKVNRINGVGTLQKLWGRNMKANLTSAAIAGNRVVPGVQKVIEQAGLQFNPVIMEFMNKVGRMVANDKTMGIEGGAAALGGGPTPEKLEAEARAITKEMTKNRNLSESEKDAMRKKARDRYAAAEQLRRNA